MIKDLTANKEAALKLQAEVFSRYLVGKSPSKDEAKRYIDFCKNQSIDISSNDEKLLNYVCSHRYSLGPIDSYLALFKPEAELRHRIYIMFAVLEASHNHWRKFLSEKQPRYYILVVAIYGLRACFSILAGMLMFSYVSLIS